MFKRHCLPRRPPLSWICAQDRPYQILSPYCTLSALYRTTNEAALVWFQRCQLCTIQNGRALTGQCPCVSALQEGTHTSRWEQKNKTSLLAGLHAFNPFGVVGSSASACIALIITEFTSIYPMCISLLSHSNVMCYKSPFFTMFLSPRSLLSMHGCLLISYL